MGCTGSKLDDLPAVALCRERCAFLNEAIRKRDDLAGAHLLYIHSLKDLGVSLHRFFDQDLLNSAAGPPSPVLNLPPKRKGDPETSGSAAPAPAIHHSHSRSHSGSHLHFNSDSEDDDSASGSLHLHSDNTTPVHPYGNYGGYADQETLGSYQQGGFTNINYMRNKATPSVVYDQRPMIPKTVRMAESSSYSPHMNINYMRNKATPSVVYEQRPMSPETVHMAESSSYNPYPYGNQMQSPNSYPNSAYSNYGANYGGFFGSSPPPYSAPQQPYGYSAPQQPQLPASSMASSSKPPPPPPSPPRGSAWDFLNPFQTHESYYPPYTPSSRDSKEVREEEGIPDLEDEDYQQEIVKEVHGHQKFVDVGGGGGGGAGSNYSKAVADEEGGKASVSEQHYHTTRPSVAMEEDDDAVEYEVHVVDKKVVDKEDTSGDRHNGATFKGGGGFRSDSEVVKEIQVQFERASDSGIELAKMLEVGKHPYNRKHHGYLVSSKMLLPMVASQPSIENTDPDTNDDHELRPGGLSSTLQKLYIWEKKLYEEVKVEEKMRILHERKLRRLKHLDEKGAEPHKVDTTRSLVRNLSTKIRISIQVVDKISVKINKVRDEDLWPQLNEFIQGLTRMWKSMLECHHSQCKAIVEARRLDAIASGKRISDAHVEATNHLAHELLMWISRFSDWVVYQKAYVKALNNWLLKCLLYEPEETADGIVPFSPSRIGAPTVFIICNQWSQALDQISEKEVVDSFRVFTARVIQLRESHKIEMQGNNNMERKVKNVDKEDLKMQKEIQALEKRMVVVYGGDTGLALNGQAVYQSDTSKGTGLQVSLQHFFEAMERFTARSLRVYEELLQRIEEEDKLAQEQHSESETV